MAHRTAIVLAAGQGTRMRSSTPKVLHDVCGQPSLQWVLDSCRDAGCDHTVVVVGAQSETVRNAFDQADLSWVEQKEQRGTGHAVQVAFAALGDVLQPKADGTLVIVYADNPLMTAQGIERLIAAAESGWAALSVSTVEDPGSLGRVESDSEGQLIDIIEYADASPEQRQIRQVNAGQYAVRVQDFSSYLDALRPTNVQRELYLTEAFISAARDGKRVACVELQNATEAWGINDREDLAQAQRELQRRILAHSMQSGVTILDPSRTTIGPHVSIDSDVVLHPDVWLGGNTHISSGCVLHQGAWIRDCHLGEDVEVHPYSVLDGAQIAADCAVGPFARLRPGTQLAEQVRIGNFVEVKKSQLGGGAKANHLAYVGDATVGERTNIGAGVVTCNYDGENKHRTAIGKDAFVGSDTMLVAPVSVGDGAMTGAGSVITDDVPAQSLALGRARQRNLVGWMERASRVGTSSTAADGDPEEAPDEG